MHRGMIYWDDVMAHYPPEQVVYIDGEDDHGWDYVRTHSPHSTLHTINHVTNAVCMTLPGIRL